MKKFRNFRRSLLGKTLSVAVCTALCALCPGTSQGWAQTLMTVHLSDGTQHTFPASQVEEVTFGELSLQNQFYALGAEHGITACEEVLECFDGTQAATTYRFLTAEGDAAQGLAITLGENVGTASIPLDATQEGDVAIRLLDGTEVHSSGGTLRIYKDKLGTTLIASVEAWTDGGVVALQYRGTFTTSLMPADELRVTLRDGTEVQGTCGTMLTWSGVGQRQVGFGDAGAETAEGMTQGSVGVCLNISPLVWEKGRVSLADDAGAFTVTLYDYLNARTYYSDATTAATLYTRTVGGVTHLWLDATLADGIRIQCQWTGTLCEVDGLDAMVPPEKMENVVQIIAADGVTYAYDAPVQRLYVKSEGGFYWFYFQMSDDYALENTYLTPRLKVAPSLLTGEEVSLPDAGAKTWQMRFQDIELQSADNDYVNHPTEGTFRGTLEGFGGDESARRCSLRLNLLNTYPSLWDATTMNGDATRLILKFDGTYEEM